MNKEQIKQHYADIVKCVFLAESIVKPTLQERKNAIGENPSPEQLEELGDQYCLDIAEEMLSKISDEELEELYGE